ncbi:MAG: AbrB/MazE/SpoVT family DNA-binding domain-containing protein [Candidatus Micrarchaeota archaeon]|nr:AbrB/MazE/SpoVT family DNA-binding domain-containing protein [Candidatus Micrarchaeota archaeon]
MEIEETKVTQKFQTTIPKRIRKRLGVKSGGEVFWHIVKEFVVVDTHKKVNNPVEFLTSQIKMNLDAVKLVHEARSEMA